MTKKKTYKKPLLRLNDPPSSDDQAWLLKEQEDFTFSLERQKEPNFAPPGIWSQKIWNSDTKIVGHPGKLPAMKQKAIRMAIQDVKYEIRRRLKMIKSLEVLLKKVAMK